MLSLARTMVHFASLPASAPLIRTCTSIFLSLSLQFLLSFLNFLLFLFDPYMIDYSYEKKSKHQGLSSGGMYCNPQLVKKCSANLTMFSTYYQSRQTQRKDDSETLLPEMCTRHTLYQPEYTISITCPLLIVFCVVLATSQNDALAINL